MRHSAYFFVIPVLLLASGCVNALRPFSSATEVRLKIQARQPQQYLVRIALEQSADYPVATDGHVTFTIPKFRNGCDMYLLGVVKVRDGSAEKLEVVELRRAGHIVRKLSLAEIAKLPKNGDGYNVVKVGN